MSHAGWVVDTLYGYLPVWLFFAAIPLGALPMVMAMEVLGAGETPLANALRRLLPALPVAAVLAIPLLLHVPLLYHWGGFTGFAARWFGPRAFAIREAAFLVVWTLLALVFLSAPPPGGAAWRRALGVLGLMLHLTLGTVAAIDWTLSLQPGLGSSSLGLLVIIGQCGTALSAAILLAAILGDAAAVAVGARPMLALLGAWMFLHFAQYLVVWSANLPGEIVWYQQRQSGWGLAVVIAALVSCAVALLLLPRRFAAKMRVVSAIAAVLLLLHLAEALWLTIPAWRGRLVVTGPDLPPMLGLVGLLALWALTAPRMGRQRARR